jgi:hypothetical protein
MAHFADDPSQQMASPTTVHIHVSLALSPKQGTHKRQGQCYMQKVLHAKKNARLSKLVGTCAQCRQGMRWHTAQGRSTYARMMSSCQDDHRPRIKRVHMHACLPGTDPHGSNEIQHVGQDQERVAVLPGTVMLSQTTVRQQSGNHSNLSGLQKEEEEVVMV